MTPGEARRRVGLALVNCDLSANPVVVTVAGHGRAVLRAELKLDPTLDARGRGRELNGFREQLVAELLRAAAEDAR